MLGIVTARKKENRIPVEVVLKIKSVDIISPLFEDASSPVLFIFEIEA